MTKPRQITVSAKYTIQATTCQPDGDATAYDVLVGCRVIGQIHQGHDASLHARWCYTGDVTGPEAIKAIELAHAHLKVDLA